MCVCVCVAVCVAVTAFRLRAATHFIMRSEKLHAAAFLRDLEKKDKIRNELR